MKPNLVQQRPNFKARSKPSDASLLSRGLPIRRKTGTKESRQSQPTSPTYSLYSNASDPYQNSLSNGLGRCATILSTILDGKDVKAKSVLKPKKSVKIVLPNTSAVQSTPQHHRIGARYNERLVSSTPEKSKRMKQPSLKQQQNMLKKELAAREDRCNKLEAECMALKNQSIISRDANLIPVNNKMQSNREPNVSPRDCSLDHTHSASCSGNNQIKEETIESLLQRITNNLSIDTNTTNLTILPNDTRDTASGSPPVRDISASLLTDECSPQRPVWDNESNRTRLVSSNPATIHDACNENEQHYLCKTSHQKSSSAVGQIQALRYMFKELKESIDTGGDCEINRLFLEIDQLLNILPSIFAKTQPNQDVEIDLAIQPFRQENSDLRRKLRIANQRMRESERTLQSSSQQKKIQELSASLEAVKMERDYEIDLKNKLAQEMLNGSKENEQLKVLNEDLQKRIGVLATNVEDLTDGTMSDKQKKENELASLNIQIDHLTRSVQASEKENKIIQLASKQKETEIERLKILNKDLQHSVQSLLDSFNQQNHIQQPLISNSNRINQANHNPINYPSHYSNHRLRDLNDSIITAAVEPVVYHQPINDYLPRYSSTLDFNSCNTSDLSSIATFEDEMFKEGLSHLDKNILLLKRTLANAKQSVP